MARLLLVFGCLNGISIYAVTPLAAPDQLMLATDVYRHAAGLVLEGQGIYHEHPPDRPGYTFLYPPLVIVLFLPHALIDSGVGAFAFHTALNVLAALATAALVLRMLERRAVVLEDIDRALIVVFFLVSSYSAIQFINGQVNLWLALAFAVALNAVDRRRMELAGVAFALAALVKVFPAIMGVWLLRIRAWRAVAAAMLVGLTGLLLGTALFGIDLTQTYLLDVLLGRFEGSTYDGRPDATDSVDGIHRQLAVIWPAGTAYHTVIGLVVVTSLLVGGLARVDTVLERDTAALATITAVLLFLPVQPLYFPLIGVPLLLLLYRIPPGRHRVVLIIGTALTMVHLDLESAVFGLELVPVPSMISAPLINALDVIFTFVLPPTLGIWFLLVGCVLVQWRARSSLSEP